MAKILFREDARKKLEKGVNALAMRSRYPWAQGRNVVLINTVLRPLPMTV